jgi:tRNA nucleotidyltransferase/poly(A) polymerase
VSEAFENPVIMNLPMEIPESLYQLIDILTGAGFEAYIVGGAVRDTLLGRPPKDYDVSTNAKPQEVIRRLAPYVKFAGEQGEKSFAVARLVAYDGNEYEFAPYRADEGTRKGGHAVFVSGIEEDVKRRDLTINALFYKVPTRAERKEGAVGEVVDYVGGIDDIENEVIRTVGDPGERFDEDRLRILRAFRFAGRVNGKLDEEAASAIRGNNSLTEPSDAAVSEERIKEELIKGVVSSRIPANYINMLIDFDLFSQILPGLKVSRAFSSSKNIAVQLASILSSNNSQDVARTLSNRKFGNDIRNATKFLLDLPNLNRDSLMGLKKEYGRLKSSSNKIINDEVIMDFGVVVGQDFNKFLEFANSPPAVSARDLIAGGMKPGPGIGEAIREAEIEVYYKENLGDVENTSEANSKIINKLIKLSIILNRIEKFSEIKYLDNIITKFAEGDIFIPKLSGHVYIFDMDDTLFWSPEWHNLASFDDDNIVSHVDGSVPNLLAMVVDFIEGVNLDPKDFIKQSGFDPETIDAVKEEDVVKTYESTQPVSDFSVQRALKSIRTQARRDVLLHGFKSEIGSISLEKQIIDIPWLGKFNQTILVAKNDRNENILPNTLRKFFPTRYTKLFDMRGKYLDDAVVVAGDAAFYQAPKTLGFVPNPYILDIYKENSENAIILTARESMPGMEEGILDRILSAGASAPAHIFTKPKGESSGTYKGEVIGGIASQEAVTGVTFYDDNLKYITSVNKVLSEKYALFKDKVEIHRVDTSNKPTGGLLEKGGGYE